MAPPMKMRDHNVKKKRLGARLLFFDRMYLKLTPLLRNLNVCLRKQKKKGVSVTAAT